MRKRGHFMPFPLVFRPFVRAKTEAFVCNMLIYSKLQYISRPKPLRIAEITPSESYANPMYLTEFNPITHYKSALNLRKNYPQHYPQHYLHLSKCPKTKSKKGGIPTPKSRKTAPKTD